MTCVSLSKSIRAVASLATSSRTLARMAREASLSGCRLRTVSMTAARGRTLVAFPSGVCRDRLRRGGGFRSFPQWFVVGLSSTSEELRREFFIIGQLLAEFSVIQIRLIA